MITIEGFEFKKEEIDDLNETFFTTTHDNQQYLVTRFNLHEMNLDPKEFQGDPFINYLNTFDNDKFRYFVYPLLKNKVIDYIDQMGNNNREKERYVQHIIRAIYNIHNSFRLQKKTFFRFSLDSYYLHFSDFDDESSGNFKESKVKVIAGLSLYPTKAGTIIYMEPRLFESFKTKNNQIDLAYQTHVRDLGIIATRLLPKNYQHHCNISNVCREFVAKCLQEEAGQLLPYERIQDERFIKENYELFKNPSYLAPAQADDPSLYINSAIKPSSSIQPMSSMEPLIELKPSFLKEKYSSKPFSSLTNPQLQKPINNNRNHLFPIIKPKKILELVYCFTYIDSTDSKKNEKTKKTIKEEAFEAADILFDKLTLEGNLNIELFPIYDELYDDYDNANGKEKKSN